MMASLLVSFLDVPALVLAGKIKPREEGERNVWATDAVPAESGWVRFSLPADDRRFRPHHGGLVAARSIPLQQLAVEVPDQGAWQPSNLAGALLYCAFCTAETLHAIGGDE